MPQGAFGGGRHGAARGVGAPASGAAATDAAAVAPAGGPGPGPIVGLPRPLPPMLDLALRLKELCAGALRLALLVGGTHGRLALRVSPPGQPLPLAPLPAGAGGAGEHAAGVRHEAVECWPTQQRRPGSSTRSAASGSASGAPLCGAEVAEELQQLPLFRSRGLAAGASGGGLAGVLQDSSCGDGHGQGLGVVVVMALSPAVVCLLPQAPLPLPECGAGDNGDGGVAAGAAPDDGGEPRAVRRSLAGLAVVEVPLVAERVVLRVGP